VGTQLPPVDTRFGQRRVSSRQLGKNVAQAAPLGGRSRDSRPRTGNSEQFDRYLHGLVSKDANQLQFC
jgi:hypothetical protein